MGEQDKTSEQDRPREQDDTSKRDGNTRVDKVVRIVASSPTSWSHAARNAIDEAAKTIHDLATARLVDADLLVRENTTLYRVKLEVQFQLDRNRIDATGMHMRVRRYLIVANQTLASAGLAQLVGEKLARSAAEFHVLVPHSHQQSIYVDPTGIIDPGTYGGTVDVQRLGRAEAEQRLESFKASFAELGTSLTTETAAGDPIVVMRRVMERSTFDEIIVSTLPARLSRWLKLDLPARAERAFQIPVTTLVQHETNGH